MDKYEEALERAKEWESEHPNGYINRDMMEFIFPGYNDSEDECTRKELIHFILYKAGQLLDEETEHKFVAYLEKQKEQKPAEWSEEDEELAEELIKLAEYYTDTEGTTEFKPHISWLKALPKRFNLQPKQEWSEEDRLARDFLLKHIEQYIKVLESVKTEKYIGANGLIDVATEISDWKNARTFILSLQPHWKPSEEQMGALNYAYCEFFKREDVGHNILGPLQNLIDTLSKL